MHRSFFGLIILTLLLVSCGISVPFVTTDIQTPTAMMVATSSPVPPTMTAQPTAIPLPKFTDSVSAIFLGDDQVLKVYRNPAEENNPIAQLEPHAVGISTSGKAQWEKGRLWIEIKLSQGGNGWVNADYVTATISPTEFCNDPQVNQTLNAVIKAIKERDENGLINTISPVHGLRIRYLWQNPDVFLGTPENLNGIFTAETSFDWGFDRSLNQSVHGSFSSIILPAIEPVLDGSNSLCDTLDQGIAADWSNGYIEWPPSYLNLNYIALYRPASQEDALKWRTWAFGMEKINSQYFLTTMVQYKWNY
ncbi:MAG: hypothetical protein ACPL0B_00800 [Anaerolineales bacterium]